MELNYRGVKYEKNLCKLEVMEGEVGGKYRGRDWRYNYPRHTLSLRPKVDLCYRGSNYSSNSTITEIELQRKILNQNINNIEPRSLGEEATQIHLDNIRRNLEHRLQVAKERGNYNLVEMLQKESRDLALI